MNSGISSRVARKGLDAHEILPLLWQGSKPPDGWQVANAGFKGVVFCALEFQPNPYRYPGLRVIHAPNNDDFSRLPTRDELRRAMRAAREVASMVSRGLPVLVTCRMGWNRSGLVSALSTHLLTGWDGSTCIHQVQTRRPDALGNPGFREVLSRLKNSET